MQLAERPEDLRFRQEVQAFMRTALPAAIRAKSFGLLRHSKEDIVEWHRILHRQGWGAPTWPKEFGGTGWSITQQKIFEEESVLAGAPRYMPQVNMIGPVLQRFGTPAQQARFLPRLITLEDWWCQGYSETGAGSDLTSLRTQARRVSDRYIVTGEKIWTSGAPWADWMFALVRTSGHGRPSDGISFLLIDMRSPGIETRWIKGIDGGGTLAQVFLNEVEVPVEQLVHKENEGWTVAKHLLGHERHGQAAIGNCKFLLMLLKRLIARSTGGAALRRRAASLEIRLQAHEWTLLRLMSTTSGGAAYSMLKNQGAAMQQDLVELMLECVNRDLVQPRARDSDHVDHDPPTAQAIAATYLDLRKVSIFAGTTEVQNNIIAKALLA